MKTDEIIRNLAGDIKTTQDHFYRNSLLIWSTGTTILLALFFFFMPIRPDLNSKLSSTFFYAETVCLFALFFVSTWIAYRSAIPGLLQKRDQLIGVGIAVLLAIFIFARFSAVHFTTELHHEMNFYRGHCGPILLALSGLQLIVAFIVARRAAPTNLYRTGTWLGASAGAMSLLAMQFICEHDSFSHLMLWHALPIALLVVATAFLGKKLLRW